MACDMTAVDSSMASDASRMDDDRYDKDERMGKMNGRCMNMHQIGRGLAGAHHHIRSPFADIHRQEGGKLRCSFESDPSYPSEPCGASDDADRRYEARERERGGLDNDHKPPKSESKPTDKKDPNSKDKPKEEPKVYVKVDGKAGPDGKPEAKVEVIIKDPESSTTGHVSTTVGPDGVTISGGVIFEF